MHSRHRLVAALSTALLLLAQPLFAFNSPLSPEAIRAASFLGQRHDDAFSTAIAKYTRYLDPPESGPFIRSVTSLTPFAQVVLASQQHSAGYSAQQAQLEF